MKTLRRKKENTLISPSIDQLLEKVDNKYILSILVAKRSKELFDGEAPLVDEFHINKVTTAIDEVYQDKVWISDFSSKQ